MTPRELMYKFSKGQIKLDEKNAKELEKLIKGVSNEFLVWWSEFVDKNPDYTHANDSHRPDKDLLDDLVLGKSSRRQIAEYCGIPSNQLDVHITNLRKAGFIVDNKVNPKYIPNYNNEDSFKFLIMFDITKE